MTVHSRAIGDDRQMFAISENDNHNHNHNPNRQRGLFHNKLSFLPLILASDHNHYLYSTLCSQIMSATQRNLSACEGCILSLSQPRCLQQQNFRHFSTPTIRDKIVVHENSFS